MPRVRESKLMTKFLLFGILLAVLPVAFFSWFSYVNVSTRIDENVDMSNRNLLSYIRQNTEQRLRGLDSLLYELSISPTTQKALRSSVVRYNWTSFENINLMKAELDELLYSAEQQGLSPSFSFFSDLGHWVIEDNSYYQDNVPRIQPLLQLALQAQHDDTLLSTQLGGRVILQGNTFYLVHNITDPSGSYYGAVIAALPKQEFFRQLRTVTDIENILILDESGALIAASTMDDSAFSAEELTERYADTLQEKNSFRAKLGRNTWTVNVADSDYFGWKYVMLTAYDPLADERSLFTMLMVVIAVSILAVSLFAVFTFSRTVYRPLHALVSLMRSTTEGESNDEFQIISQYIETTTESRRLLESMLEEQQEQVRALFFANLFEGKLSTAQFESRIRRLRLPAECRWFCVSLYRIESLSGSDFFQSDRDLAMFAVRNIVSEFSPSPQILFAGVFQNILTVLHRVEGEDPIEVRHSIYQFARRLLDMTSSALRLRLDCGISPLYERLDTSAQAYLCALEALKYHAHTEENAIVFYDDISRDLPVSYSYPKQLENTVLAALHAGDSAAAENALQAFVDDLLHREIPYPEFQRCLLRLVLASLDCLQEKGTPAPMPELSALFELGYSTEAVHRIFQNLLEPHLRSRDKEAQPLSLSEQIVQIVREEYGTPLTLEYCASRVGYHPSYVSRVFRQQMGLSFKEYLYLFRIERAKELLVGTDMKLQDISNLLCYNNPQNFIRIFKKVEGMTPGEYRSAHSREPAPPQSN